MNMTSVTSRVEAPVAFELSLIKGLTLGIELLVNDEEEDEVYAVPDWAIIISLFLVRISIIRLK